MGGGSRRGPGWGAGGCRGGGSREVREKVQGPGYVRARDHAQGKASDGSSDGLRRIMHK